MQWFAMSHYILLVNFTDQGIKNVKDSPKRAEAFKTAVEKTGGKLLNLYYTLGKHDIVAIVEAPNDEAIASVLFATGSQGNARTKTLKAFRMQEALGVVDNNTHRLKQLLRTSHDSSRSLFRPASLKAGHQTAITIFFWAYHLHISSAV